MAKLNLFWNYGSWNFERELEEHEHLANISKEQEKEEVDKPPEDLLMEKK